MELIRRRWKHYPVRAFQVFQRHGIRALVSNAGRVLHELAFPPSYKRWIVHYDSLDQVGRKKTISRIAQLQTRPTFSVIVPVCDAATRWFRSTLNSVEAQLYPDWELCLGIGSVVSDQLRAQLSAFEVRNHRIRIAHIESTDTWAEKANRALALATGDFITVLDCGDTISEDALYWASDAVLTNPDVDLIFSDEDSIEGAGHRVRPWFKSDWNPALMLACNAFGRLGLYRRRLVNRLGGFRTRFDGAEEYDLVLRCARATGVKRIRHIDRILYHRRALNRGEKNVSASGDESAGRRAIADYLTAHGIAAEVHGANCQYQVHYAIPQPRPRVSIIIATTAIPNIAEPCFTSVLRQTTYGNFEVLLLVNRSLLLLPERAALIKQVASDARVHVIEYSDRPFNYSTVNNLGAAHAYGQVFCFLNDDTEIITADWVETLVSRVLLPGVAAAGPMLYYPNGTIQQAGIVLGLGGGIAGHACSNEPPGSRGYFSRARLEQDVSCVTAACLAIRADVFRTLGGFDEAMPLAYNDVDLCIRLRSVGYRIIWTPAAELVHRESASLGRHDEGSRAEQFARDVAFMRQRWGYLLGADPFYNSNLSLKRPYHLAFPPRRQAATAHPLR
jgi:O-antigen biosynthesis protein